MLFSTVDYYYYMPTDTNSDPDDAEPDYTVHIDPDDIGSVCSLNPIDADGPTDVWCGNTSITMAFRPAGHRVYLCEDHAEQATRFGDDVFDEGVPTLVTCVRCVKPTPPNRITQDSICEDCR